MFGFLSISCYSYGRTYYLYFSPRVLPIDICMFQFCGLHVHMSPPMLGEVSLSCEHSSTIFSIVLFFPIVDLLVLSTLSWSLSGNSLLALLSSQVSCCSSSGLSATVLSIFIQMI